MFGLRVVRSVVAVGRTAVAGISLLASSDTLVRTVGPRWYQRLDGGGNNNNRCAEYRDSLRLTEQKLIETHRNSQRLAARSSSQGAYSRYELYLVSTVKR